MTRKPMPPLTDKQLTRQALRLVDRAVNRSHKIQTPEQKRRWMARTTLIEDLQAIESELDRRELKLPAMLARAGWHMVLCEHAGDLLSWYAVILGLWGLSKGEKSGVTK